MADEINVSIVEDSIDVVVSGGASWAEVTGKPVSYPAAAVQVEIFANPLSLDGTDYKSFKCTVTGDTTVNITGVSDGDAGSIELIISGAGGYTITMGTMFTKKLGSTDIVATTAADNFISWI